MKAVPIETATSLFNALTSPLKNFYQILEILLILACSFLTLLSIVIEIDVPINP